MQNKAFDNKYRTTILCVDKYDGRVPNGRLYNSFCEEGQSFSGAVEFFLQMEKLLDSMNFPQPFNAMRSFAKQPAAAATAAPGKEHKGDKATFALKILFRQNATWQGTLTWLESGQEESFRSVLELISLLDSSLNS